MAKVEISDGLALLLEEGGSTPTVACWVYLIGLDLAGDPKHGVLPALRRLYGDRRVDEAEARIGRAEHAAINQARQKVDSATLVRSGATVYRVGP